MATYTLKELISEYGLPLDVKKPRWYGSYFFRAESINQSGTVSGIIIKNGYEHERKRFFGSDIMELINPKQAKKQPISYTGSVENPNNLDTDRSHYIPGVTKLFFNKDGVAIPAIFDHFSSEVDGQMRIYVIKQGETKPGFFLFPQTNYIFPNKDDAQSKADKEYRDFGISPSSSIIKAFGSKPEARKPSEDKPTELCYEKWYHAQVDSELKSELEAPQRMLDDALHDKRYADSDLRESIIAAHENGCMVDDHTYISHQIRKGTADARIASAQDKICKIEDIRRKPYFARIDCGSSMNELHTVYLGDEDIGNSVVSWRHPEYGNAYYQSSLIHGRGDIVLALKRIVNIHNRQFDGFDDEINLYSIDEGKTRSENISIDTTTDELLTRLLKESRADKRTHDIIKTIQGEQYDIITSDFTKNAVINGCAGSGKTMIMYHRLSYMAYNFPSYLGREFNPDLVYIISPSDFFDTSNDELLTKLSINTVHQAPFYTQVESLLDKYCVKNKIIPFYGIVEYVGTEGSQPKNFFSSSEFNNYFTKCKSVDTDSIGYKQWVVSLANMILETHEFKPINLDALPETAKKINELFASSDYYYNNCFIKKGSGLFYSKLAVTGISLENITSAFECMYDKTSPQYIQRKKRVKKTLGLLKCCLAMKPKTDMDANISTNIPDFWSLVSSPTVYEKMLSVIAAERLLETLTPDKSKFANFMLQCLWTYKELYTEQYSELIKLYILQSLSKKFGTVIDDPALIFIDEFQNFSPFEIKCLKSAYEEPVFNLFGDYDQCIEEKGFDLKSKLSALLSPNSYNINVNYRNAKPITEYINRQVHKNMKSIGVNGTVTETTLDQCEFKISARTAIICKDPKLAITFLKRYIDISTINNSTITKELRRDKYTLIIVSDCKGLEFDSVYVLDYEMTENEKYVAYTRALDTLVVISDDLKARKKAEEAEKRRKEEQLRRNEEQEHNKKKVLYTKLVSVFQQSYLTKTVETDSGTTKDNELKHNEKHERYFPDQPDYVINPINERSGNRVSSTPEEYIPDGRKLDVPAEQQLIQNQRPEEEIRKLQEYRVELERKEEEIRKLQEYQVELERKEEDIRKLQEYQVELERKYEETRKSEYAKNERLYSLAISKVDSDDISQLSEAIVLLEIVIGFKNAFEMIAHIKEKISKITAQEQARKEAYRRQNLCQYCGGKFKGAFNKQCCSCGRKKDY